MGATNIEELAVKLNTILTEKNLVIKTYAGPGTLKAGELAVQGKNGETFTLPAAGTANQVIGVFCASTITSCKVTTSGGVNIFGDFLPAAGQATITLTTNQHVVLQSGGTEWLIVAGEPKREQTYSEPVARVNGTEYEPSSTRPTFVFLTWATPPIGKPIGVFVGSVKLLESEKEGGASFIVPPAQKWRYLNAGGGATASTTYLTL